MDLHEGLDYKKKILELMQEAGITDLSELTSDEIDSNDSDDSENSFEPQIRAKTDETSIRKSAEVNIKGEAMYDFQAKVVEMKQYLDEFPTLTAQLNTELAMIASEPRVIAASSTTDNSLEQFIWKFNITFTWEDKDISLPIQDVREVTALNSALTDEMTYLTVVSFFFIYISDVHLHIFLFGRLTNFIFELFQQHDHLVFVYGKNKLRNMSIAAKRLFNMLISEHCSVQLSWTGKGQSGRNEKLAFKDQNNIIKVLIKVLQVADGTYNEDNLREDVVYKILKPKKSMKN